MIITGNIYQGLGGTGVPLSLTTIGDSGPSTYDPGTGILNVPVYAGSSPQIIQALNFPGEVATLDEIIVPSVPVDGMYRVSIAANLTDGTGTIDAITFNYNNIDSEGLNLQPFTGGLPLNTGNPGLLAQTFNVSAVAGSEMSLDVDVTGDVLYNISIVVELLFEF